MPRKPVDPDEKHTVTSEEAAAHWGAGKHGPWAAPKPGTEPTATKPVREVGAALARGLRRAMGRRATP